MNVVFDLFGKNTAAQDTFFCNLLAIILGTAAVA